VYINILSSEWLRVNLSRVCLRIESLEQSDSCACRKYQNGNTICIDHIGRSPSKLYKEIL